MAGIHGPRLVHSQNAIACGIVSGVVDIETCRRTTKTPAENRRGYSLLGIDITVAIMHARAAPVNRGRRPGAALGSPLSFRFLADAGPDDALRHYAEAPQSGEAWTAIRPCKGWKEEPRFHVLSAAVAEVIADSFRELPFLLNLPV